MEASWKDAIKRVLSEAAEPLHYKEISEAILSRGYFATDGATPAATVSAQISTSIIKNPESSPFIRVGKGIYSLRTQPQPPKSARKRSGAPLNTAPQIQDDDLTDSIIHSFGMYWRRDLVVWKSDPRMFGKQQAQSKAVDFGKQKGLYVLYDHHTVVYVGRAIDRPLGRRLFEHTVDRLASRWNRFSWFGLLGVTQDGNLREMAMNSTLAALVTTLEALLIETLEPPQNRKRGDDLTASEYIQDVDPELREKEIQTTLRAIEQKMRAG